MTILYLLVRWIRVWVVSWTCSVVGTGTSYLRLHLRKDVVGRHSVGVVAHYEIKINKKLLMVKVIYKVVRHFYRRIFHHFANFFVLYFFCSLVASLDRGQRRVWHFPNTDTHQLPASAHPPTSSLKSSSGRISYHLLARRNKNAL